MVQEKKMRPTSGGFMLFFTLGIMLTSVILVILIANFEERLRALEMAIMIGATVLFGFSGFIMLFGFIAVAPNQARVLLLFGEYKGSVVESGFWWVNPFYSKKLISLRVRNFETGSTTTPGITDPMGKVLQAKSRTIGRPSKVNDRDGNPIEISAVVVWQVVNTAEAIFGVDDYEDFVHVQTEAALRNLASKHPYDSENHEVSLRGNNQNILDQLRTDIEERLEKAGAKVIEARISHLAYAPEIASAMLQRQQAQAVIAARALIVEGAVGMVEMALNKLSQKEILHLDEERRAVMVSNLLVVLCGDRNVQPILNTGTIY